jgi:deoxyribodipyrimidine photolyase-related protein
MKTALILYPNQLFPFEVLPEVDAVVMVEEPLFFGRDQKQPMQLHKQKLILHRASMRRYVEEILYPNKVDVDYVELDVFMSSGDVLERVKKFEKVFVFDPVNEELSNRLLAARRERGDGLELEFLQSPNFFLTDQEVRQYFADKHERIFADFYQWQRERFNILIDENYKPVGGAWSFDDQVHGKLPKDQTLPSFAVFGDNKFVQDAIQYVEEHFPNNPGSTDFIWPTNHEEAGQWLHNFIKDRLGLFGLYEDALNGQAAWLYHSAISSSLNTGLLSPKQVIKAVLAHDQKEPVGLPSLEGFIRQILGWREFTRGEYVTRGNSMQKSNPFKQQRKLTKAWYHGSLGLPPYDDVAKKINARGYLHHNERLMVVANLMTLCEIHPEDVYKWCSEMFVDAYDWAVIPNTYGIGQFEETAVPYISAASGILQLSDYERGYWSDVWDGLYWRFIEKNSELIKHNRKLKPMIQRLERLDPDHRRVISYRAEDFLAKYTIQ